MNRVCIYKTANLYLCANGSNTPAIIRIKSVNFSRNVCTQVIDLVGYFQELVRYMRASSVFKFKLLHWLIHILDCSKLAEAHLIQTHLFRFHLTKLCAANIHQDFFHVLNV